MFRNAVGMWQASLRFFLPSASSVIRENRHPYARRSFRQSDRFSLSAEQCRLGWDADALHRRRTGQSYPLPAWRAVEPGLIGFGRSDGDPIIRGGDRFFRSHIPGAQDQPEITIEGGGHFLQEDKGEEIAERIVEFMKRTPASHQNQ